MGTFPLSNIYFARNITLAQTGNARAGSHAPLLPRRKVRCAPPKKPTVPLPVWKSPRPPEKRIPRNPEVPQNAPPLSPEGARKQRRKGGPNSFFLRKNRLGSINEWDCQPQDARATEGYACSCADHVQNPNVSPYRHRETSARD